MWKRLFLAFFYSPFVLNARVMRSRSEERLQLGASLEMENYRSLVSLCPSPPFLSPTTAFPSHLDEISCSCVRERKKASMSMQLCWLLFRCEKLFFPCCFPCAFLLFFPLRCNKNFRQRRKLFQLSQFVCFASDNCTINCDNGRVFEFAEIFFFEEFGKTSKVTFFRSVKSDFFQKLLKK